MDPYTISKLSAKYLFCAIHTTDNTDGKVRIVRRLSADYSPFLRKSVVYDRPVSLANKAIECATVGGIADNNISGEDTTNNTQQLFNSIMLPHPYKLIS